MKFSKPKKRVLSRNAKLAAAALIIQQAEAYAARQQEISEAEWKPDPGPQTNAYNSEADVVGYGGAAGGGKSDLIIGLASTRHHKSIIFRREYPQIKDIIRRAKEITEDTRVAFNGQDNILTLASGSTIEFGAMKQADDWQKYKGRPHDLKCYDEATEFLESQVRASMGWLRTTREGQRTRVVMTFNPPTSVEGMWITRYFGPWLDKKHPNPAKPGELRWYARIGDEDVERPDGEEFTTEDGQTVKPTSRTFFPSRLADNPRLMKTGYGRQLMSLPEPLRSQLLYGDFHAGVGLDPWQVLPMAWVEAAQARWVALKERGWVPGPMSALGFDVAHGGKDKTAFAPRHGVWFAPLTVYPGSETPDGQSAAKLAIAILRDGAYVNVDAIGYGASAHERLRDAPPSGYGVQAQAINFGCRSEHFDKSRKFRCINLRAEAYWRLRELLDPENGHEPALPPDPLLLAELCEGKFEITPQGIKIESKDDIKERLGHSPDLADALALSVLPNGLAAASLVGGPVQPMLAIPDPVLMPPTMGIPGAMPGYAVGYTGFIA